MDETRVIYCSEAVPEWQRRFVREIQTIQAEPEAAIIVTLDANHDAHVLGWSANFPIDAVIAAGHLMDIAQKRSHFPGGLAGLMRMILDDPKRAAETMADAEEADHGE